MLGDSQWNERWKLAFQNTRKWSRGCQAAPGRSSVQWQKHLHFSNRERSSGKPWLSPRVCWALPAQHLLTVKRAKGNSKVQELLESEQDEGYFHAFPSRLFLTLKEFESSAVAVPSPSCFWAELFKVTPHFPAETSVKSTPLTKLSLTSVSQNTPAKLSPTTTTLTATIERGKDGKLKYLLRQDLFVPPSSSKPNCRHQNIGLVHPVLVIQQFCKYWISWSLCWKSSSFQLPRWTQPGQAHIRKSRSSFIKYWSSSILPRLPLTTHLSGTLWADSIPG